VDLHGFDADPDPDLTFHHFDADPDTNPDPTLSSTHVGKSDFIFIFIHSNASLHCYLSRQCHRYHDFQYIEQYTEIFWGKKSTVKALLNFFLNKQTD
jgi:hypothetical protein